MEAIVFIGIQATGKSTFYKNRFFNTHVRISMDLLNTRHREDRFLEVCTKTQQAFVVDNTNPTLLERKKYIDLAKSYKYKVIGYYFRSTLMDALERNDKRSGKDRIVEVGVRGTYKKLEIPSMVEGFDQLYVVDLKDGTFLINEFNNEV